LGIERSSGNVFFDIVDNNGREKIKNIAENLASGQFQFTHNGQLYIAQTNNWAFLRNRNSQFSRPDSSNADTICFSSSPRILGITPHNINWSPIPRNKNNVCV
uniref:Uncharacterized protein n=1 Tax=Meloidogyne floridensis TaxID=298350 RepID=A0A915P153_9BILA